MVIPLIMGKMAKDLLDGGFSETTTAPIVLAAGFVAAFVSGWFACRWMIRLVKNCQLWWFSIYCFAVGGLAVAWTMTQH
jgi:undecaprenyl-diphosphatase